MQRYEDLKAKQGSAAGRSGSADTGTPGSPAYISRSGGASRAPPSRASDAGSRRSDGQASSSPSKSAERPSMTGSVGTSRVGQKTGKLAPAASKTMPPAPPRTSDVVKGQSTDQQGAARSPSTTKYPPSASSGSVSGARSSRPPSVSSSYSDSRNQTRDGVRRPSVVGPSPPLLADNRHMDKNATSRRSRIEQYRNRQSDDDIQRVQRRRSDSPQDIPRPPRDRDCDRGRARGSSCIDDSGRNLSGYQ